MLKLSNLSEKRLREMIKLEQCLVMAFFASMAIGFVLITQ